LDFLKKKKKKSNMIMSCERYEFWNPLAIKEKLPR
jgi:hypothetical protein